MYAQSQSTQSESVQSQSTQPQSPNVTLDQINVEAQRNRRRPARTAAPATQQAQPEPQAAPQESAYGPVQGYIATQSATGTKTDTPLREIPQSISVVTADEVKDQAAQTIQESIRYVPSTYADAYGPDPRGDYPKVRGADPNIYLDGMQAVNAWSFNEWRPDPYTLSRIEVLRGPSSILYGAMSTAGIINMVSKRPQAESYKEIGVQYGSFNRKQIHTDMTGKLTPDGEWLYRLIGVFRDSEAQVDYSKNDRILIQPAITWQPTKNTSWTLLGFYQKDRASSVGPEFLPHEGTLYAGPNGFIPMNRFVSDPSVDVYQTKTASISSLFEHTFSESFKVRQSTRYLQTEGIYNGLYPNVFVNPGLPDFPFTDSSRRSVWRVMGWQSADRQAWTSDTNGELKFATGPVSHKVLFGADLRRVTDRSSYESMIDPTPFDLYAPSYNGIGTLVPYSPLTLSSTRQSQSGIYLQDQMRFGQWIAVAGIRHDRLTSDKEGTGKEDDQATTSRLGLMYELPGGLTPYVTWGQSFDPIFGGGCLGGSLCKPKEGELKEVGFKYNPWKGLTVNAALYDITEKNRTATDPAGTSYFTQTGEVQIRGGEVELLSSITRDLDIIATYSYTDAKITQGDFAGSSVEAIPLHLASLWAKHRFSMWGVSGFMIGGGVRYVGDSWSTGYSPLTGQQVTITTPAYTLYDAMFGYEDDKWRFQINAINLADKRHVTTCLARGDCFYGQSRTILTSLTYKF